MPDLFEFSRTHCVAICAVLVPANLLATLQTLLLIWFRRSPKQIYAMSLAASLYALLLILHVLTWLAIGVVMLPTYILTGLGSLCLLINLVAVALASHWSSQDTRTWMNTHG
ncbi:hypothetical protein [Thermocoleostomius sinensis]|uniref:Uncharacterized protein n=1 Tax=Thermocoleostomius sinensis A174 TaxID=2016057 RepID=A0A9E8ZAH5_9CYAN|nr:hypothetical protein [Thermocoleostomius sinensis]WAL58394.1 hypothetical protein OXH18_14510 [Thermocoleostomius sinensis A174]